MSRKVAEKYRLHIVGRLAEETRRVGRNLTVEVGTTPASRELLDLWKHQVEMSEVMTNDALAISQSEPHRASMLVMAARLEATLTRTADLMYANADELLAIGRRFGVASPATSLLVLESLDQWLRHDIEPPATLPQMREQWLAAKKNRPAEDPEAKAARHLEMLKEQWKIRMEWWNTDFSKIKPQPEGKARGRDTGVARRLADTDGIPAPEEAYADEDLAEEADGAVAYDAAPVAMAAAPAPAGAVYARQSLSMAAGGADAKSAPSAPSAGSISVKAWSPDTPYLKALDAAGEGEAAHAAYLAQRADWAASPAFYLDCAGWFFGKRDYDFGVRVLSNLAELRIEDPALLRVLAWRLKEAAAERLRVYYATGLLFDLPQPVASLYDQSAAILRRVCKLRPEDAQSWRDLALALDEAGRAHAVLAPIMALAPSEVESHAEFAESAEKLILDPEFVDMVGQSGGVDNPDGPAPGMLAEALDLYRKVALTPWARHPDSISLFAVEEYNALHAWCTNSANLMKAFEHCALRIEPLPEGLRGVPDCDMRVVMAWDADETDVDLHVTEPSGEEAYYGHRRTRAGGDVSKDITDGYGPEEYLLRKAPAGGYRIRAHYFASHQQEVFGPATATATIFTDWGRPNQDFQTLSIRLDKAREMIELGEVAIVGKAGVTAAPAAAAPALRKDMTVEEVKAIFGDPATTEGETLAWPRPGGRTLKASFADGKLVRAVEVLPGGAETILVQ